MDSTPPRIGHLRGGMELPAPSLTGRAPLAIPQVEAAAETAAGQRTKGCHSPHQRAFRLVPATASSPWEKAEGVLQMKNNRLPGQGKLSTRRGMPQRGQIKGPRAPRRRLPHLQKHLCAFNRNPGKGPGFHNRNAAGDVVWRLTWLLFPLLFYTLIKVFSPDQNVAGWQGSAKALHACYSRGAPAALVQSSRSKPPESALDPGHPHWHRAGGDTPQHGFL